MEWEKKKRREEDRERKEEKKRNKGKKKRSIPLHQHHQKDRVSWSNPQKSSRCPPQLYQKPEKESIPRRTWLSDRNGGEGGGAFTQTRSSGSVEGALAGAALPLPPPHTPLSLRHTRVHEWCSYVHCNILTHSRKCGREHLEALFSRAPSPLFDPYRSLSASSLPHTQLSRDAHQEDTLHLSPAAPFHSAVHPPAQR